MHRTEMSRFLPISGDVSGVHGGGKIYKDPWHEAVEPRCLRCRLCALGSVPFLAVTLLLTLPSPPSRATSLRPALFTQSDVGTPAAPNHHRRDPSAHAPTKRCGQVQTSAFGTPKEPIIAHPFFIPAIRLLPPFLACLCPLSCLHSAPSCGSAVRHCGKLPGFSSSSAAPAHLQLFPGSALCGTSTLEGVTSANR